MSAFFEHPTLVRLALAMILGSAIGAERQWRHRAAGMRTNTLVCFGAAAFVDLGSIIGGPGTTNLIAYVISGVGFLGAGAIMKEGGSIRGLNTAATLWCSAAVGACAGAGQLVDALAVSVMLVTINLALRPLSRWIDLRSHMHVRGAGVYRLTIVCSHEHEQAVSALLMRALAVRPVTLRELRTELTEGTDEALIEALLESGKRDRPLMESLLTELRNDANVTAADWAEVTAEAE